MSVKKLTQQELDQVNEIKKSYDQLTYNLGQVEVQFAELEDQKQRLKDQYRQVKQKEIELGTQLEKNYGKGNINLSTGEFTPIES